MSVEYFSHLFDWFTFPKAPANLSLYLAWPRTSHVDNHSSEGLVLNLDMLFSARCSIVKEKLKRKCFYGYVCCWMCCKIPAKKTTHTFVNCNISQAHSYLVIPFELSHDHHLLCWTRRLLFLPTFFVTWNKPRNSSDKLSWLTLSVTMSCIHLVTLSWKRDAR